MKAGFSGGLVVDFPHSTRAKKYFLVLMVGSSSYQPQAKGIDGDNSDEDAQEVQVASRQRNNKRQKTANGNIQVMQRCISEFFPGPRNHVSMTVEKGAVFTLLYIYCRVLIGIQKLKAKTGFTRRRLRCAKRATPMFLLIANTQAENEKTTGRLCLLLVFHA